MDELALLADADRRAHAYLAATNERRAFPDAAALAGLTAFDEPLPDTGRPRTTCCACSTSAARPRPSRRTARTTSAS